MLTQNADVQEMQAQSAENKIWVIIIKDVRSVIPEEIALSPSGAYVADTQRY